MTPSCAFKAIQFALILSALISATVMCVDGFSGGMCVIGGLLFPRLLEWIFWGCVVTHFSAPAVAHSTYSVQSDSFFMIVVKSHSFDSVLILTHFLDSVCDCQFRIVLYVTTCCLRW